MQSVGRYLYQQRSGSACYYNCSIQKTIKKSAQIDTQPYSLEKRDPPRYNIQNGQAVTKSHQHVKSLVRTIVVQFEQELLFSRRKLGKKMSICGSCAGSSTKENRPQEHVDHLNTHPARCQNHIIGNRCGTKQITTDSMKPRIAFPTGTGSTKTEPVPEKKNQYPKKRPHSREMGSFNNGITSSHPYRDHPGASEPAVRECQ